MPGENIFDWSTTAANNDTADTLINWREGMARAAVNDSARSLMAAHAKVRDLWNGTKVTGGTPNAQTFTSGYLFTSIPTIPTGLRVLLKIGPGLTNTAAVTLDMDTLGGIPVKTQAGGELSAGRLLADGYAEFVYNGTVWVYTPTSLAANRVVVQTFTASGTYTPTNGMLFCTIECIGGGGGGGGSTGGGLTTFYSGGGGGAGGYSRKTTDAGTIGASQIVTIGAGGAGGPFSSFTGGGAGGATSVGSICIANGGVGASPAGDPWGLGTGGPGASPGTGDIAAAGAPGAHGEFRQAPATPGAGMSGEGGSSFFGGGALGVPSASNSTNGNNGSNYGGGGSGSSTSNALTGGIGGVGSAGFAVITETCV